METEASSRSECTLATLAEMPETPECSSAASERAAVLLGSEIAPQCLLELSLLLLGERFLIHLFFLGMTFIIITAAAAPESSKSA
jgi:hypothetical protein